MSSNCSTLYLVTQLTTQFEHLILDEFLLKMIAITITYLISGGELDEMGNVVNIFTFWTICNHMANVQLYSMGINLDNILYSVCAFSCVKLYKMRFHYQLFS